MNYIYITRIRTLIRIVIPKSAACNIHIVCLHVARDCNSLLFLNYMTYSQIMFTKQLTYQYTFDQDHVQKAIPKWKLVIQQKVGSYTERFIVSFGVFSSHLFCVSSLQNSNPFSSRNSLSTSVHPQTLFLPSLRKQQGL